MESFPGKEYYSDLIAVNSGRNALLYLLKARKINKLYLPQYLCESVSLLCQREGYDYSLYHIDENFRPVFDQTLKEGEYLYVVNAFGQLDQDTILELKARYHQIIVDNVQAFFQRPLPGVDTVYSCRKFFGVPDGGYVATDIRLREELRQDVSRERMTHVLGRGDENCASAFYEDFKKNDRVFAELPLMSMSRLTHNLLQGLDYLAVRTRREQNFSFVHERLKQSNPLKLRLPEGPYAYPFYCENGMEVKKHLAERGIYVATLWPVLLRCDGQLEKKYAENILPLPIDQRYAEEDMEYMLEEMKRCMNT